MAIELENVLPSEIEKRSFEIITEELTQSGIVLDPEKAPVIKRCIHTSADFDYAQNLVFSENAIARAKEAIRNGASIVTDTQMGRSGINKKRLAQYGGQVYCFMSDEDVAEKAKRDGTTRAVASMEKACELDEKLIFAIGNAPTALIHLYELIRAGKIRPELVIGVPVGFVNVIQSKELILELSDTPYIVARGLSCSLLWYHTFHSSKERLICFLPCFFAFTASQMETTPEIKSSMPLEHARKSAVSPA